MRLKNKTVLVTGGSRGLGKVICTSAASEGATIILNYAHNQKQASEVVSEIEDKGGKAYAVQGDITSEEGVRTVIREAKRLSGSVIDVLVNNATGPQPELSLEDATWEDYEDQLRFFVKAPLLLVKELLADMKMNRGGSIINIGSDVIQNGNPHFSNYVTAKSAMLGMTRSWAKELGSYGIRVNLLNPGFIPVERHDHISNEAIESYQSSIPLQRMGTPNDLAQSVIFLASDESSFVTGQSLTVNGGYTFG